MENNFGKQMGNVIKILRLFHGIKQKHLAESLNIKASLLSLYEQGKREPTLRFLKALCSYNNLAISDFFKLVETQTETTELGFESNNYAQEINKMMANVNKAVSPTSN